jgi:hypothetical protein
MAVVDRFSQKSPIGSGSRGPNDNAGLDVRLVQAVALAICAAKLSVKSISS